MDEFVLSMLANKVERKALCSKEELVRALADVRFFEITQRILESMDSEQRPLAAAPQEEQAVMLDAYIEG